MVKPFTSSGCRTLPDAAGCRNWGPAQAVADMEHIFGVWAAGGGLCHQIWWLIWIDIGVSSKFKSQILTWTKQFMVQCAPAKSWYHGIIPHGGDSWIALPRKHPPQWHRGRCEHETKNMKLPSKMFSELSWREHLQESTINIHKSWERPWFPLNVPLNSCETNLLTYRLIIPAWFQPWHNCQQRCFQHVEETNCLGHNNCTYVFWK